MLRTDERKTATIEQHDEMMQGSKDPPLCPDPHFAKKESVIRQTLDMSKSNMSTIREVPRQRVDFELKKEARSQKRIRELEQELHDTSIETKALLDSHWQTADTWHREIASGAAQVEILEEELVHFQKIRDRSKRKNRPLNKYHGKIQFSLPNLNRISESPFGRLSSAPNLPIIAERHFLSGVSNMPTLGSISKRWNDRRYSKTLIGTQPKISNPSSGLVDYMDQLGGFFSQWYQGESSLTTTQRLSELQRSKREIRSELELKIHQQDLAICTLESGVDFHLELISRLRKECSQLRVKRTEEKSRRRKMWKDLSNEGLSLSGNIEENQRTIIDTELKNVTVVIRGGKRE